MNDPHLLDEPSVWVARFGPVIPRQGRVLDLACGTGRHTRLLAELGHPVLAVDVDVSRLGAIATLPGVTARQADLEGAPWPFADDRFAGIVVINYLHRPLLPKLLAALDPGGVLIYETFAIGNERFGRPSNPDFLLAPGELLDAVRGVARVVAFEDLVISDPRPAAVQRICAVHL
jgi:SAM-dependent methyltransferase